MGKELVERRYTARIDDIEHVYDGDTINHCMFSIADVGENTPETELYPDLFVQDGKLWVHVNVRLTGIDAPEYHPHHRLPNGELRDINDVSWEHSQAVKAKRVVQNLLSYNSLQFEIRNPQLGKYAERVVAEVWVKDPDHGQLINVSKRLLTIGLAYPYEGGTKQVWNRPNE